MKHRTGDAPSHRACALTRILAIATATAGAAACSGQSAPPTRAASTPRATTAASATTAATGRGAAAAPGRIPRVRVAAGERVLTVEVLDDDLVHFELRQRAGAPDAAAPIATSPMVADHAYAGPSRFEPRGANAFRTRELEIAVDPATLCVRATDAARARPLTTVCPSDVGDESGGAGAASAVPTGLAIAQGAMQHAYGLGQQFVESGSTEGDWTGRVREPGGPFGNEMVRFNGGMNGNVQVPVLYAVGPERGDNYALFLDNVYRQRWDLRRDPWTVDAGGGALRWYLLGGADLPDLRRDYMELVGRAPVPPKKTFGFWLSEYGYDNWAELESRLAALRAARFPVDGFVLDLQWFGGITHHSDATHMGHLAFDPERFPDARARIAALRQNEGVGLIAIEESYVGRALPEHRALASRGLLVRRCERCPPAYLTRSPWWGTGAMVDWTNDAAGDFWHDEKRHPLVELGIVGHWTDLGEPESYDPTAWYQSSRLGDGAHAHADVHNLYNLRWAESIFRGYARHRTPARPFILSRSGTAGIQRFGAAMWSGDIGSEFANLATQQNAQLHMALSGVDYYGSDIGGFIRSAPDAPTGAALGDMFTRWFADGMALDVPGRVHTENLCNCRETSPARLGDVRGNLAAVRRRYALSPYVYSLAHRAHRFGEPVFPPPIFYYQDDAVLREMGHEKLIGRDLLVAVSVTRGETARDVYLPRGAWVDFETGARTEATGAAGRWLRGVALRRGGAFALPLYARAGAVVPMMFVDDQTMNVAGLRRDGTRHDELIARVFPGAEPSGFTLFEDDGETNAYREGAVRETEISQRPAADGAAATVTVTVAPARGSYTGAPDERDNVVELVTAVGADPSVTLDGAALPRFATRAQWAGAAGGGFYRASPTMLVARSGARPVTAPKVFAFTPR